MANGHGGARPGAGRKRKDAALAQRCRRDLVLNVFSDPAWEKLLRAWLVLAEDTPSVIYPLLPYILGGKAQDEAAGSGGSAFTIRIEHVDSRGTRPDIRILDAPAS